MMFFRNAHHELRETETLMDELGHQFSDAIVSQIVEQLWAAREENGNSSEPPVETPSFAQPEVLAQANATTDMPMLMRTMMATMEHMFAQIANNNNNNNGTGNGHNSGHWNMGNGRGNGQSNNRWRQNNSGSGSYDGGNGTVYGTSAKATVPEDVEMVLDDATDAGIVAAHTIMGVLIAPIITIMKSAITKSRDYTTRHIGISPINPINATLPPMDKKARQRSQTWRQLAPATVPGMEGR